MVSQRTHWADVNVEIYTDAHGLPLADVYVYGRKTDLAAENSLHAAIQLAAEEWIADTLTQRCDGGCGRPVPAPGFCPNCQEAWEDRLRAWNDGAREDKSA